MKALHEFETPESDKAEIIQTFVHLHPVRTGRVSVESSRLLEQRLAACREALDEIIENGITPQSLRITTPDSIAKRALALTAPTS